MLLNLPMGIAVLDGLREGGDADAVGSMIIIIIITITIIIYYYSYCYYYCYYY